MTIVPVDPIMSEELFQHIWQFRLFTQSGLSTLEGDPVQIDHPGQLNRHAGPDFTAARIRIGNTLWVGNVELHLRTSDWFRHGHQHNLQYRNVVLHIVFEHDVAGDNTHGIPILELRYCIPKLLLQRYEWLRQSQAFVPCAGSVAEVPSLVWTGWKDRLLIERLEQRADVLKVWLLQTQYDWEEVCYRALARGIGMPVNGETFLALARSLPYKLLLRHQHDQLQLEALLFGQAGMLEDKRGDVADDEWKLNRDEAEVSGEMRRSIGGDEVDLIAGSVADQGVIKGVETRGISDEYMRRLRQEYTYLRRKYKLIPMDGQRWKWLRMRPASFPTMKIAAMAALLHRHAHLFSVMLEAKDAATLIKLLEVPLSGYWQTHYRFGKPVAQTRMPGKRAVHNMLINTVLPLLYVYGREKKDGDYQEKAVAMLRQLPPEDNHLIREWKALHVSAGSAGETQALLQLKQTYCEEKRCLHCAVGARLVRSGIA
ncbi:DUF2851 family protein [Chitinophaga pinensis]|uniref:DUF2851 family protein n=1 Tax=Chitinophaga pinensis TaxID=79329 RepID=A0A5C6M020_9BACT|nr:DUF2851 family protein [Chitinophaga pinensis]TWW01006.1 DUF2851 family protein [Chitinophaga pinensis]